MEKCKYLDKYGCAKKFNCDTCIFYQYYLAGREKEKKAMIAAWRDHEETVCEYCTKVGDPDIHFACFLNVLRSDRSD